LNGAIEEIKAANDEFTEEAKKLIKVVSEGDEESDNLLGKLNLDEDELRRKSDDIVAVFEEEVADEIADDQEDSNKEIEDFEHDLLPGSDNEDADDSSKAQH